MIEDKPVHHESTTKPKVQKTSFSRISPSAKLLIVEHGLDASSITPSGPRGTILKGDVLAAIKSGIGSTKTLSSKEIKPPSPQVQKPLTSSSASLGLKSDLHQADAYEDLPNSQIRKVSFFCLLSGVQRDIFYSKLKVTMKMDLLVLSISNQFMQIPLWREIWTG